MYKRSAIALLSILITAFFVSSCGGTKTAQIWTDRPEFAFYGELFNTSQTQYKVSIKYYENPGQMLNRHGYSPDIVVGSWIKNSSTKAYFRTLDNLFGANKLSRDVFYQDLLAIGRIDRNQYLLPVSFNIPALIFSKNRDLELSSSFTIDFDEIKKLSQSFNAVNLGTYTRMGFSPLWSNDFLMTAAVLQGAMFREEAPLTWDNDALERSMDFINNWTIEINTSNQAEEDFRFKYFVEPAEKLIQNERILFSYINSGDFFILSEDTKNNLDYRWIMEQSRIPLNEDMVLLGIPRRAKNGRAARAFIQWFFDTENQKHILGYCMETRISENVFGICGGFSTLSPVTEQVFPRYYPKLLGRMPPYDLFLPPNILPGNWPYIKERVVLPYLNDRSRTQDVTQILSLERRLSDWIRVNR